MLTWDQCQGELKECCHSTYCHRTGPRTSKRTALTKRRPAPCFSTPLAGCQADVAELATAARRSLDEPPLCLLGSPLLCFTGGTSSRSLLDSCCSTPNGLRNSGGANISLYAAAACRAANESIEACFCLSQFRRDNEARE